MISGLTAKRNLSERRSAGGGGSLVHVALFAAASPRHMRPAVRPTRRRSGLFQSGGGPFLKFIYFIYFFRGRCRKWRLSLTPKSSAGCSHHGRSVTIKEALGLANTETSLTEVRMRRRMLQTCGILGNVVMRTYTWWPLY